jgi:hypothetical protein
MPEAPITFLSHASEDKERFVRPLAVKLRTMGIDAWFDEWEIDAGDSLVDRIFEQGIDKADAFVVVLSVSSIDKPWLREELDAAVVARIGRKAKLIPVRLDDVKVPAALRHLKWVDALDGDVDKAAAEISRSIFGLSSKPPLGPPPTFSTHVPILMPDPVDDIVLAKLINLAFDNDGLNVSSEDLFAELASTGLTPDAITESVEVLAGNGYVQRPQYLGGTFAVRELNPAVVLHVLPSRGVDVDEVALELLAHISNQSTTSGFPTPNDLTRDALISYLDSRGWIKVGHRILRGAVWAEATAAGKRVLRQQ